MEKRKGGGGGGGGVYYCNILIDVIGVCMSTLLTIFMANGRNLNPVLDG